ncbi:MAG TPA: PAS domain S-box protein [Bryobacteraceae bacterium]|nr:PAS domain S-box protein [Bryobacteraceae bacterium]
MERLDYGHWKAKEVARLLALVETEKRYYQEIVASLPVALAVLSADRSVLSVNRAFRQTFGLKSEDLRGKSIDQILPSPQLIEKIREVHMHGTSQPHVAIDVNDRPLRATVMPIRTWDDEGEAETLLMVQETFTAPIAQPRGPLPESPGIPAVVWQADAATFAFTSVNGAAERLLGYPVPHWLSSPQFFRERIHPEDRAATLEFYEDTIPRHGDASAEFRAVTASGNVIWCRETIRVDQNGVIAGVLTDISLRKQLEAQLLNSARSDALHGLASKLAHDLNNPLMIITGYSEEMLHALQPEDPMRKDVEQVLGATERISGITGQLLGFTRRLAKPAEPVNVAAVVSGLEEKITAEESVKIEIEPGDPVWALANAEQLEEAILALTSGAREDAKQRTRVKIVCDVAILAEQLVGATLAPGIYATITIHDNGRGTDAKIFEAIVAKDDVGPAITRAYASIREWGGDIAFSSEPFRGSTFTIYLPYSEATRKERPTARAAPIAAPAPPPVEQKRETILLVEDEPGIRALVRKILRREKYTVLEAGSAEEAINVVAAHKGRVDMLVTDVMLPGKGGRELAVGMRASLPDLKVLYISGFTSDEEARAGALPPGAKFLQKPFTLGALIGKVREALG